MTGPTVIGPAGERLRVSARLGWLYLEQEHLAEAEAIFHAVLAWRSEDEAARRGLDTIVARRRALAPAGGSGSAASSRSRRERQLTRLRAYLATIRRALLQPASRGPAPPEPASGAIEAASNDVGISTRRGRRDP